MEKIKYRKCEGTPNIAEKMREYTDKTLSVYNRLIEYIEARARLGEEAIILGDDYNKNESLLVRLRNEGFLLTEEDGYITVNW